MSTTLVVGSPAFEKFTDLLEASVKYSQSLRLYVAKNGATTVSAMTEYSSDQIQALLPTLLSARGTFRDALPGVRGHLFIVETGIDEVGAITSFTLAVRDMSLYVTIKDAPVPAVNSINDF